MKLAIISPINSKCGISTYTQNLYKTIADNTDIQAFFIGNYDIVDRVAVDEPNVFRLWKSDEENFSEVMDFLSKEKIDIVHIQTHSNQYYRPVGIEKLIEFCNCKNIKIIITFHIVKTGNENFLDLIQNLKKASVICIQNEIDYLENINKYPNLVLQKHPFYKESFESIPELKSDLNLDKNYPILLTFGFLNKNKNIDKIFEAVEVLKQEFENILLICLNSVNLINHSALGLKADLEKSIKAKNLEKNVLFITEFLEEKVIETVFSLADINLLIYSESFENGSGALKYALISGNPIVCTDIKAFEEYKLDSMIRVNSVESVDIAEGIKKAMNLKNQSFENQRQIVRSNTFAKALDKLIKIYQDLT